MAPLIPMTRSTAVNGSRSCATSSWTYKKPLEEGPNVMRITAWSLLDNFKWQIDYKVRLGLVFVDFVSGRKRLPKASTEWFRTVAGTGNRA